MPIRQRGETESIKLVEGSIEEVMNRFIPRYYDALIKVTPVETGFHRSNWLTQYGAYNPRKIGERPAAGRGGQGEIPPRPFDAGVWTVTSGNVYFHNSGDVIDGLEEGYISNNAPQGMLLPALAQTRGLLTGKL
jgi:hypothetical protein